MRVTILDEAEREFMDDASYYERKETGLGVRFRCEVASIVDHIAQDPQIYRLRQRGYRRVNLRAFPHFVAYIVRDEIIWIVAISHSSRRPEHWIGRM